MASKLFSPLASKNFKILIEIGQKFSDPTETRTRTVHYHCATETSNWFPFFGEFQIPWIPTSRRVNPKIPKNENL